MFRCQECDNQAVYIYTHGDCVFHRSQDDGRQHYFCLSCSDNVKEYSEPDPRFTPLDPQLLAQALLLGDQPYDNAG